MKTIEKDEKNAYHVTMKDQSILYNQYINLLFGGLVLAGLYFAKLHSYLLFHNLAEIFSIVIGFGIFVVAWNTRKFQENNYFLFLGIAYLFVAGIDLVHNFTYKGMGIFPNAPTNLATQLWIAARYLQAVSLLAAPFFLTIKSRKIKTAPLLGWYIIVSVGLLLSILWWKNFPIAFVEGQGLTQFKIISEYVISFILLASLYFLYKQRAAFEKNVFHLIAASIIVTIAAEFSFTLYTDPYGIFNMVGHYFKIVAFYLIYRATIVTGLNDPYHFLFRSTKKNEEALQIALKESGRRHEEMQALLDSTQAILAFREFKDAASSIFNSCKNLLGAEGGCVTILDNKGEENEIFISESKCHLCSLTGKPAAELNEIRAQIYKTGKPIYSNGLSIPSEAKSEDNDGAKFKNVLFAPIINSRRTVGLLSFTNKPGGFFENDAKIAVTFGRLISISLANHLADEKIAHMASFPRLNINPIAEIDMEGNVTYANPALTELFPDIKEHGIKHPMLAGVSLEKIKAKKQIFSREVNVGDQWYKQDVAYVPEVQCVRLYNSDITERKKAEEQILKLKLGIERSTEAVFITDKDGAIIYVNPMFEKLYGYKKDEALGQNPRLLKSGEHGNEIYDEFWKTLLLKKSVSREFINKTKSGRNIFVEASANPIIGADGKIIGFLAIQKDITDRKNIEKALKKSEQKYRDIIETSQEGIWILDQQKKVAYANQRLAEILGYEIKEIISKNAAHFLAERESFLTQERRRRGTREKQMIKKDGSSIWVMESMNLLTDENGNDIGTLEMITDITTRKIAEEKLKSYTIQIEREKAEDEALLSSLGDAIVAVDRDNKILYTNKAFEELAEAETKDLKGKDLEEIFSLQDHRGKIIPSQMRPISHALSFGKKVSVGSNEKPYYFAKDSKNKIPLAITAAPIILGEKTIGAISVYRDITKEKEVDRAKTEFVSLASHQLRTPLSSVSLSAEMLLGGIAGDIPKEQKKYLRTISSSVKEMTELIEALLNVSRIEMGTLVINPEPTNIAKLTDDVLKKFSLQLKNRKLELKKQYDKNLSDINIDQKLMRLILDNLISNAAKYTRPGGKIEIELARKNLDVLIRVSDTGCGIPRRQHSEVFKKLFRSDNELKSETKGTGLGLYMVRSAVNQYGGKIWFNSEEQKGTDFYVTVPLSGMNPVRNRPRE